MLRSFSISFKVSGEKGALPSKACRTMPSSRSPGSCLSAPPSLQYLEQAFFHADAGLDAFDDDRMFFGFDHVINLPKYQYNI